MASGSDRTKPRDPAMPYRHSWVDALVAQVERLPGPAWLFYVLATLPFVAAGTGLRWFDGTLEVGTFWAPRIVNDIIVVFGLAAIHRVKAVGRNSLATFRPALGEIESHFDTLHYELTTMSRREGVVSLVVSIAFTTLSMTADPEAWDLTSATSPGVVGFFIVEGLVEIVLFLAFVFFAYRQLRVVVRIHRDATRIRLLESSARNGFSSLTLNLSILVALPVYLSAVSYLIAGEFLRDVNIFDSALIVGVLITASLIFGLPLYGLHKRLLHEKAAALMAVGVSFVATTRQLHEYIAAAKFDQLGGVNTALSSLIVERDVLKRASTWPWEAETFRGFLSSIALPILLWLVTNLLGRLLGA